MHPEEYLDLVNEHDEVIGSKLRKDVYAEGLTNIRYVNVFLRNSEGKLWIPRRTAHKAICPLHFDFSASGHVSSGESYDEAFAKEVHEELNIDINSVPHRTLEHITPKSGIDRFMTVYEITSEETPVFNTDDFIEAFWLTPEEIIEKIQRGEKAKTDIPLLIKRFYL